MPGLCRPLGPLTPTNPHIGPGDHDMEREDLRRVLRRRRCRVQGCARPVVGVDLLQRRGVRRRHRDRRYRVQRCRLHGSDHKMRDREVRVGVSLACYPRMRKGEVDPWLLPGFVQGGQGRAGGHCVPGRRKSGDQGLCATSSRQHPWVSLLLPARVNSALMGGHRNARQRNNRTTCFPAESKQYIDE